MPNGRDIGEGKFRPLTGLWRCITFGFPLVGMLLAVYQTFHLRILGFYVIDNSYLYLLLAIFLPLNYLYVPLKKGNLTKFTLWMDIILASFAFFICLYFAWYGFEISFHGYGYLAPPHMVVMGVILWALVLEAVRRASSIVLCVVILIFSLYPLYAPYMPGFLEGYGRGLSVTASFHSLGSESLVGIPMRAAGQLMMGFLIFGIALQASGGGDFFLKLSNSLLGSTRGGPAKVSVLSSAFFGSMSGSVVSNVITTGSVTIPAIKKTGYPPHYAGAIECVASTGGTMMPPVMGSVAFVMASFLAMPYANVALAAAIPSFLAYLGLLVQVDGYAARNGLLGLPRSELPSLKETLREGWFFFIALMALLYFMFIKRLESQAPFYAVVVLIGLAMLRKETRFSPKSFVIFIERIGRDLCGLIAMLSAVGLIIGSLALSGVAVSFSREIVSLAGGNFIFMLVLGAFASFILGMGMTTTPCYIFLAIVMAPGLVMIGLNEVAVHLYVMYWGMLSYITPPVALASFPAATIAGSSPVKVGITSMKLGGIKYLVPLFFVLDPGLVLQAGTAQVLQAVSSASAGIFLMASVLENYLVGVGNLKLSTICGFISGAGLFVSGFILALPSTKLDLLGLGLAAVSLLFIFMMKLATRKKQSDRPQG